ncbi:MAG: hypothetical protein DRQ78_03540 [Epsilonproteobacteria bacterium]|nr:MAG: hypothetical protein DRQ78_03540 [Campylobacterota bacterium]
MKKVLILCTGNSCRSIMAEALINANFEDILASSSGVKASGKVNPNAKKVLQKYDIWKNSYYSKTLDSVINYDYDLVVTVCEHAQNNCPVFPKTTKTLHISFNDPDGKDFKAFEKSFLDIKNVLLPKIRKELSMKKQVFKTNDGVKITFTGAVEKKNIMTMVENCATGQCDCMSEESKKKITDMQVSGKDGEVVLSLLGDVSKKEIESALTKSKIINT